MYGFVFIGTPHCGLEADAMIAAVQGQPTEPLIRDLKPSSTTLKRMKEGFSNATQEVRVISCFELKDTPTLKMNKDGIYAREGEKKLMVTEDSACLFWSSDRETRIPINENHSMIAKLSTKPSGKYRDIKNNIAKVAKEAVERVYIRFDHADILDAIEWSRALLSFIARKSTGLARSTRCDLSDLVSHFEAFSSNLSKSLILQAYLGSHLNHRFVARFSEKQRELQSILSPFEALAFDTDHAYQSLVSSRGWPRHTLGPMSPTRPTGLFTNYNIVQLSRRGTRVIEAQQQILSLPIFDKPISRDASWYHFRICPFWAICGGSLGRGRKKRKLKGSTIQMEPYL